MARRALALLLTVSIISSPALSVTWADTTADAQLNFQVAGEIHPSGNTPYPAFPEIMGTGACFADFDGDGYPDLYLVNQRFNPHNPAYGAWADALDPRDALFRNGGDGTFTDITTEAQIDGNGFGLGCSAADYDGDGDIDLFVANFGPNFMYRNDGDGTFTDVSDASGMAMADGCLGFICMSTSSAWADYDGDGDLDLYVGNYVDSNLTDTTRGPQNHLAQFNFLMRNNGDGTFTDVAKAAGVRGVHSDHYGSKTLGVVWFDHDVDGDPDLYVANDEVPNDLYVNNGDGTFVERSNESGLADPRAGMGLTSGDYDDDGYPDLFFTHYRAEQNGFYRNLGNGTYEDRSGEDDLTESLRMVGWGTQFADLDLDTDLDIVLVNGHTDWTADMVDAIGYNQTAQVFRNDPEGTPSGPGDRLWVDITAESGALTTERVWRGLALSDYDLDGDLDAVLSPNANQSAMLATASGADGNWLRLELRQPGMNPNAIGARVVIHADGGTQHREVQAGASYLSQNDIALTIGLGDATQADRIDVYWPNGGLTTLVDIAAGQVLRLDRASGLLEDDTLSPWTQVDPSSPGVQSWWAGPVSATVSAVDRGITRTSGLVGTEYRIDDGPWTEYSGQTLNFASEGLSIVAVRSDDAAGNAEPPRRYPIGIDMTAPTPTYALAGAVGNAGWHTETVTVTLGMEDALSGSGTVTYRVDGGDIQTYDGPFVISGDGVHHVAFVATDVAGNSAPLDFSFRIDATAPEVDIVRPRAGAVYVDGQEQVSTVRGPALLAFGPDGPDTFQVAVTGTDSMSGLAMLQVSVDGVRLASAGSSPLVADWYVGDVDAGVHTLLAEGYDVAGLSTQIEQDVVVVPAAITAPTGLGFGPYPPAYRADVIVLEI